MILLRKTVSLFLFIFLLLIQYIIPVKGELQSAIILLLLQYLFLSFCVQLKCDENNTKKARFYFIKQKKKDEIAS